MGFMEPEKTAGIMTRKVFDTFRLNISDEKPDENQHQCLLQQYNCNTETEICVNVPGKGSIKTVNTAPRQSD